MSADTAPIQPLNTDYDIRLKELDQKERQFNEELALKKAEQRGAWKGIERGLTIAIPLFIALIPASFSYYQFLKTEEAKTAAQSAATQSEANAKRERAKADRTTAILQARSAFAAKRITLYEKAVKVTGDLMVTRFGTPEYQEAQKQFELLYWSQLPLVEDGDVASAMIALRNSLKEASTEKHIETEVIGVSQAVRTSLKDLYEPDDKTGQVIPVPQTTAK